MDEMDGMDDMDGMDEMDGLDRTAAAAGALGREDWSIASIWSI